MTQSGNAEAHDQALDVEFHRRLGLFDATMVVVGAMIGSGIFLVSAEMSRLIGSPGWLLVAWLVTGALTIAAALSYGELAGMMPKAGGQYVFLREAYSPFAGFLYGWTLILVIQAGSISAVAVAFARFTGVIFPEIAEDRYLIAPWHLTEGYALSLSTAQLTAIVMILALTATNVQGVHYGRLVQNFFTVAKTGSLLAMIALGLTLGWSNEAVERNFGELFWSTHPSMSIVEGLTAATIAGVFVAICVAQTGSLFSSDSWNNVAIIAGEIRNPRRNIPAALALGVCIVIGLYLLANVAYLVALPLETIQNAPNDRVATVLVEKIFPGVGEWLMAAAIMASTFGCNNGLILAGARASFAMARDGLFLKSTGKLNAARVPANALVFQAIWASLLVIPRTFRDGKYGNLYVDLLDYVISAALLFYILTIIGLFRLRRSRPDAPRPYRAFGYPVVPALYVVGAGTVLVVLFIYRPMTTWPGMAIVLLGAPVYAILKRRTGNG